MEIVVRGRNVEVPEHFRQKVEDKVGQLERFDGKVIRIDVELLHEKNPRQTANAQRVEITLRGKGPVARAEASAPDFYAALELAAGKLENHMRRANDRRRVHHGRRTPPSVRIDGVPTVEEPVLDGVGSAPVGEPDGTGSADVEAALADGPLVTDLDEHLPGRIVREKVHPATPMHIDQALYEMELVGHDFFLFLCADTGVPSVVYRRHAFDYGLIRLGAPADAEDSAAPAAAVAASAAAGDLQPAHA
ncbi:MULTISPECIES: ribosome hibernation-promoting factor, HPF/YfiA family [unclassified Modestobacter]|uniref:ribosome hibernation-promoting factor, HPF/YfiA family n=1 Tax=unclassified Modestobacter TaxID=2643866 RepID=UPI0022AADEBE|nr:MULTISPECIES: ribosome-associated translation inhibitor RaiA [unclassified Modestobacter]MCZ2823814.1 ribosome-associated translation inhibitor RaiA [Modestobacter sp. VKM Ac-2981]MCZ2852059.1 ribosome-associated translation inhibitor RaiA [Modestobacter sp. VKM Ac-2982]